MLIVLRRDVKCFLRLKLKGEIGSSIEPNCELVVRHRRITRLAADELKAPIDVGRTADVHELVGTPQEVDATFAIIGFRERAEFIQRKDGNMRKPPAGVFSPRCNPYFNGLTTRTPRSYTLLVIVIDVWPRRWYAASIVSESLADFALMSWKQNRAFPPLTYFL